MKKINMILAAFGALLMLSVSVTSANSVEIRAGVSASAMGAYANAKETLKGDGSGTGDQTGRTTEAEAVLATSFASIFAEVSSEDLMGLGLGISYAPEVADLNKETRHIANPNTSDSGNDTDGGVQAVDAKINDLISVYLKLPVPGSNGAYFKAGYIQATMVTEESLATGSKYADVDMTGMELAGGYEGSLGDMAFWRAEGSYQMWDDLRADGSEPNRGTGDTTKNRIDAEIGSVTGTLSLGMKF